jgi:hypothetical protein
MKQKLTTQQKALIHIGLDIGLLVLVSILFFIVLLPVMLAELPRILVEVDPNAEFTAYDNVARITFFATLFSALSAICVVCIDTFKLHFFKKLSLKLVLKNMLYWLILLGLIWLAILTLFQIQTILLLFGSIPENLILGAALLCVSILLYFGNHVRHKYLFKQRKSAHYIFLIGILLACFIGSQFSIFAWFGLLGLFALHSAHFFVMFGED